MAVWYLDTDDEITDAVDRLRNTSDARVVFVVPTGSRIATGRINFKLLAREAASRDLRMAVASADEQVRALSIAAGVLTLPTADEAEAALERGDEAPPVVPVPDSSGVGPPGAAEDEPAGASEPAARTEPVEVTRAPSRRRRISIVVFVVLALVVLAGVTSFESLTTAEIVLVPRTATMGPIEIDVTALTSADAPDPEAGHIPAVEVEIPLEIEGTFPSSGIESAARQAAGVVSFSSQAQSFDLSIAAGTRVETQDGIAFQTVAAVVLPRSPGGTSTSTVLAPIEAVETGPEGNVEAGAITIVTDLGSSISVTNPEPTTGGAVKETPVVTRADYDRYVALLTNQLGTTVMDERLTDPAIVPDGLTLFPETRSVGPVAFDPGAAELVGQPLSEFTLRGVATGTAIAVDRTQAEAIATAALLSRLPEGMQVLPGSMRIEIDAGAAVGQDIEFSGSAWADASVVVDTDGLRAQVAGLPISEAQAILEELGTATVTVWPDFLGDFPEDPGRITLNVQEPSTTP